MAHVPSPDVDRSASFVVEGEIGSGALARVLRVRESGSDRRFAGKVLHPSVRLDPAATERFAQEARLAARLDHPNVVRVFGLVESGPEPMLLMELVEGPSLAEVLAREGPLPWRRAAAIAAGIAQGLAAAHAQGIIHRDLKLANILLAPGDVPKIADFGLARAASLAGVSEGDQVVAGTPETMAPESVDPLQVDPRADLYALGCVLFELLTQAPPYTGATPHAVLHAHRNAPVPELPGVPPGLGAFVRRLLAKVPAERPATAGGCARALERILAGGEAGLVRRDLARASGRCARCGGEVVPLARVCFACGLALPSPSAGAARVLVVGPGEPGDKIDAALRERLVDWLRANDDLGLDARRLAKKIPRLPFVLASGVDGGQARAWVENLEALGLAGEVHDGPLLAHRVMRDKLVRVGGRAVLVGLGAMGAFVSQLETMISGLMAAGAAGLGTLLWRELRPQTRRVGCARPALEPTLAAALDRVVSTARRVRQARYRESLRVVTQRALALRAAAGADAVAGTGDALGAALAAASAAVVRLEAIDAALAGATPEAVSRDRLQERDLWSARLLELLSELDELGARVALARERGGAQSRATALDDLRHRVEALEEVAALTSGASPAGGEGG